jgi:enamine deaminase RidA (YjgF/YER057c/UK114 family)
MKINTVNAESAPQAAGGYSQAVAISGAERLLFISGQIPQTAAGDVPGGRVLFVQKVAVSLLRRSIEDAVAGSV